MDSLRPEKSRLGLGEAEGSGKKERKNNMSTQIENAERGREERRESKEIAARLLHSTAQMVFSLCMGILNTH